MWFFLSVPASVETINVKHKKTKTKNFKKRWKNGENISKKKSVTDEKKNYRTNGNEWIRCVKIIECVNLWCKLLIFCSLYLSILSVNDAKTRLKKASRMSLFYLLSYYDTDKSEINIESIFKNCPGFRNLLKKSQLFYRQTSRQLYEDSFLSENIAWKLLKCRFFHQFLS